eukprot:GEMP01032719.1.p1 GENE.GEMP01032719.1~~GEMP01032719.1.p1  ORF type:complete len:325 (+),score=63.95 GEMP01032719.1:246-1220(+)
MFANPVPMASRRRLEQTLSTGTTAWDAMCPLGLGASMIIQGPSERILTTLLDAPKVDRVLDAGGDYLQVFEAIAVGSERAVQDREHILCVVDMSKFPSYFIEAREVTDVARGRSLEAQAELAEKRAFYSQVFERAVCHIDGGTLTLVCKLQDMPIGDFREMQSLSDGHLLLNGDGSIDYRTSLSRFGMGSDTKGLRRHKMLQRVGSHIRTELCQFSPDETPLSNQDAIGTHLAHVQRQILAAMKQTLEPVPVEEQVLLLVAASTHVFKDTQVLEGGRTAPIVEYFHRDHQPLMEKLAHEGDENLEVIAQELNMALRVFNALQMR